MQMPGIETVGMTEIQTSSDNEGRCPIQEYARRNADRRQDGYADATCNVEKQCNAMIVRVSHR